MFKHRKVTATTWGNVTTIKTPDDFFDVKKYVEENITDFTGCENLVLESIDVGEVDRISCGEPIKTFPVNITYSPLAGTDMDGVYSEVGGIQSVSAKLDVRATEGKYFRNKFTITRRV